VGEGGVKFISFSSSFPLGHKTPPLYAAKRRPPLKRREPLGNRSRFIILMAEGKFACQNRPTLNLCMEKWGGDKQHSVNPTVKSWELVDPLSQCFRGLCIWNGSFEQQTAFNPSLCIFRCRTALESEQLSGTNRKLLRRRAHAGHARCNLHTGFSSAV